MAELMPDKPSMLIVDDEPEITWALEKVIKRSGYNCLKALSGKEAIALAETTQFRLIFLDAKLPDIEGLELARQIHRRLPGSEIVMISGYYYRDDEDIKGALSSGLIRHFISKPFDHEEILRIVQDCLPV
jgi:CheY-like chemotaxis protein